MWECGWVCGTRAAAILTMNRDCARIWCEFYSVRHEVAQHLGVGLIGVGIKVGLIGVVDTGV
jgi:hypothetical protein